jgi:hypothetical protein
MYRSASLLELLHPDGWAERAVVVGDGCPPSLLPTRLVESTDPQDLILIAPSRAELRNAKWLPGAVRMAAERLADDGVAYLVLPRRWRRQAIRLLTNDGLLAEAWFAHLPEFSRTRHLVPLSRPQAVYAFSSLVPARRSRRRVALALLSRRSGVLLLAKALPATAIAARRPGARPLFDWLYKLEQPPEPRAVPIVTSSCRENGSTFVVHSFPRGGPEPNHVVKIRAAALPGTDSRQLNLSQQVAATARDAGAAVPDASVVHRDRRSLVRETAVTGKSAMIILGDAPTRLPAVQQRLADWLEAWHRTTLVERRLTDARLDDELIAPAMLLAPYLDDGHDYVDWLTSRCAKASGSSVPFVATHNDLTMSNVFIGESGSLGVVDWETARSDGLPLVDFAYAMADAAAATNHYANRVSAFLDCFGSSGRHARHVAGLQRRLQDALTLSPTIAELYVHACWLHHAANEQRTSAQAQDRPFLDVLRALTRERRISTVSP